jgi:putative membrane protein
MKKLSYFIMVAASAYVLQSCHSNSSSKSTDSTTTTKDSTTKTTMVDSTKADSGDVGFAKTLAQAGTAEIKFSQLAQQKTKPGMLNDFAAKMIADHTKAADSLKAIAQKENITLPDSMDAVHKQKYTEIQEMSGDNFNKAYVMLMVADHKGAVNLLQNESQNGKDPALKGLATKILPTVQGHLDMANKLQAGMK